jgi:hypothetical protein
MRRGSQMVVAVLALAGCPKPEAKEPEPAMDPAWHVELGALMKNEINPPFSKLTFLVFHGEGMDDKDVIKAQIQGSSATLRKAIGRLRTWEHPPTTSAEGRDVFYSFASTVDMSLAKFEVAINAGDDKAAAASLDQVAKTCDSCHHFFRIDVPETGAALAPGAAPGPGVPAQSL